MAHQTNFSREKRDIDDIDRGIISRLQKDGRCSLRQIAQELNLSDGAVRYRLQRLRSDKILQVVGIADPLKVGFDLMAMLGIKLQPGTATEIAARTAEFPESSYVAVTAGSYDLLVEVVCENTSHFYDLLARTQALPGVEDVNSLFIMDIHKMAYGWDVSDTADHGAQPEEDADEA